MDNPLRSPRLPDHRSVDLETLQDYHDQSSLPLSRAHGSPPNLQLLREVYEMGRGFARCAGRDDSHPRVNFPSFGSKLRDSSIHLPACSNAAYFCKLLVLKKNACSVCGWTRKMGNLLCFHIVWEAQEAGGGSILPVCSLRSLPLRRAEGAVQLFGVELAAADVVIACLYE